MSKKHDPHPVQPKRRALLQGAAAVAGVAGLGSLGFPAISLAQNKPIRIGMPTILSGRVAMLGQASSNAAMMEVEKFNAIGGLGGRKIELIIRDSKGQPQEAARVARELITSDGCEILVDAEASSGAFAVHEVARDLGVLVMHTCSETSALLQTPSCAPRCHFAVPDRACMMPSSVALTRPKSPKKKTCGAG